MSATLGPVSCLSGLRAERTPSAKRGCHVQQRADDPPADRSDLSQGLDSALGRGHHSTATVSTLLGSSTPGRSVYLRSGSARYRGLGSLAEDEEHGRAVEQSCS